MFEAIQIDEELASKYGLTPMRLKGLGHMVAVTGPNGAGKTRLLELLAEQLQADRNEFERLAILATPKDDDKQRYFKAVTANAESIEESLDADSNRGRNIAAFKRFMSRYRPRAGDWRECFRARHWPRIVRLSASADSTGRYRWKSDESIDIGLRDFPQEALDHVAQARYLTGHPAWPRDRERLVARAKAFAATVEALLGVPFGVEVRDTQIVGTLNGRRIVAKDLSEGQRLLLRWTEIIHDEVDDVRDALLLIDEPELHLHPAALIDTMERLRKLEPAQILVATHSVPLLAWIGPAQIFRMERGTPSWAGSRIDQALAGLLGGEDGVETLRTFLSDSGSLAFHQFAAECLLPPGVVGEGEADRQTEGFVARIGELLQGDGDEVRVLEYGAGKGRLMAALATTPISPRTRLRYFAHNDPQYTSRDDAEACRNQLARLYESVAKTPAVSSDLRAHKLEAAEKMHAVVLCNVLHEVPPRQWPKLMADLQDCLRPDGHLLIFEDQRMRVGELPHDAGYLVLDEVELCALFGVSRGTPNLRFAETHDGRLSIAEVSAAVLRSCASDRVAQALKMLRTRALEHIQSLRRPDGQEREDERRRRGRLHAYYAMLFANASLACAEF